MEFNATEVMPALGIKKIERVLHRWLVVLDDGRNGVGSDAAEALAIAKAQDAPAARKWAA